jgi:hypothetical protein
MLVYLWLQLKSHNLSYRALGLIGNGNFTLSKAINIKLNITNY